MTQSHPNRGMIRARRSKRSTCCSALACGVVVLLGGCPSQNPADESTDPNDVVPIPTGNQPPVANAGDDQAAAAGALVVLDGSQSSDPNFDRLSFIWRQVGGAPAVALQNVASSRPQFFAPDTPSGTTLTFRLTVADGLSTATDETVVTVQPR